MKLYIIVEEVKNHEPTLIQNFEKKYFIDQLQFLTAPVQFFLKKKLNITLVYLNTHSLVALQINKI